MISKGNYLLGKINTGDVSTSGMALSRAMITQTLPKERDPRKLFLFLTKVSSSP